MENTNTNIDVNETVVESTETEVKTYSQEEVMALLQSETDKRVTSALKKQQAKFDKQLSLSRLDGDAREKAEKDNRIAELEEMLTQFTVEKNKSELKSVLGARGLSPEFADIINITDDIETSQSNIDKLDKLFKAAVKAEVEKRLAENGGTPRGNGHTLPSVITKEVAAKMSLAELSKLQKEQPEVFAQLYK